MLECLQVTSEDPGGMACEPLLEDISDRLVKGGLIF
jgi:hypothetical protein